MFTALRTAVAASGGKIQVADATEHAPVRAMRVNKLVRVRVTLAL